MSALFTGLSGQELLYLDQRLLSPARLSLEGGVDRARPDTPELWSRSLVEPIKPSVGPENAGLRSLLVPGLGQLALGNRRGWACLLYTSPSPRDLSTTRMPSSA